MYHVLTVIGHSPLFAGALTGFVSSAYVDLLAFRSWKSFHDAEQYDWSVAAWRWFQGATLGLLTSLGIAGLS